MVQSPTRSFLDGNIGWIITVILFGLVNLWQFSYSTGTSAAEIKQLKEQMVNAEDFAKYQTKTDTLQESINRLDDKLDRQSEDSRKRLDQIYGLLASKH